MSEETDRPATVGTDHKRRGTQSPETAATLATYRIVLRLELADTLAELRAQPRPKPADRVRLATLAIKLARQLETGSDPIGAPHTEASGRGGKPPKLTRAERARLA